jgi:hypothetical protein
VSEMTLTLTSGQVAEVLGYFTRDGRPDRQVVRKLVRDGRLPSPIDIEVAVVHWRWARTEIDAYVAGTWRAAS